MRHLHPPARVVAVGLLATGLALTLAGCGSDDAPTAGPSGSSTAPTSIPTSTGTADGGLPPDLATDWSTKGTVDLGFDTPVHDGDTAVVDRTDGVVGVDLATGTTAWHLRTPADLPKVCAVSSQVSADHLVGVMLGSATVRCTRVGAVDTRTGKLAWVATIPGQGRFHEGREVAVGAHTLLATIECDEVTRFRLSDGKQLSTIAPRTRDCADATVTDGQVVSVYDDGASTFSLYDADSGRRRWVRPTGPDTSRPDVVAVLSDDPLVLTDTVDATGASRLIGPDGRPGPYVGKTISGDQAPPQVVGQGDGVLVLTYPGSPSPDLLFGYDLATGRELWHVPPTPAPATPGAATYRAEVRDDRLVLAVPVLETHDDGVHQATWVTSLDLHDPTQVETLGRADGTVVDLHGDRLVTTSSDTGTATSTASTLPTGGVEQVFTPTAAGTSPGGADAPWADDDLRPDDTALACEAVKERTLAVLGLERDGLPAPSDCHFGLQRGREIQQGLTVTVSTSVPSPDGTTAEAAAHTAVQSALDQVSGQSSGGRPTTTAVTGLGDEAWRVDTATGFELQPATTLVVRWRNVVVQVAAAQDVLLVEDYRHSVPDDRIDVGALDAVADVLTHLGAPASATAAARVPTSATPVPSVIAPCDVLSVDARTLVPGGRAVDGTPPHQRPVRTAACTWDTSQRIPGTGDYTGARLEVTTWAATSSPFGGDASANAARLTRPGLFTQGRATGPGYRSVDLVTVHDNQVTSINYVVWQDAPSRAALTALVKRLAEKVDRAGHRR